MNVQYEQQGDYLILMYTTNAVESINSNFRKVTKKGAFPIENALLKLLYLHITELYKKWNDSKVQNWAIVRNQLSTNEKSVPVSKNTSTRFEPFMQGYFVSLRSTSYPCIILFITFLKKLTHFY